MNDVELSAHEGLETETVPVVSKSVSAIVSGLRIGAARHVSNLSIHVEQHLDLNVQVTRTMSTCSLYLYNIGFINSYLTQRTEERVVNVKVTSRLDYCNALLFATTNNNIGRLQRLQDVALSFDRLEVKE